MQISQRRSTIAPTPDYTAILCSLLSILSRIQNDEQHMLHLKSPKDKVSLLKEQSQSAFDMESSKEEGLPSGIQSDPLMLPGLSISLFHEHRVRAVSMPRRMFLMV
jgi:hypothetical protein